jgi:hypothetical protein
MELGSRAGMPETSGALKFERKGHLQNHSGWSGIQRYLRVGFGEISWKPVFGPRDHSAERRPDHFRIADQPLTESCDLPS